MGKTRSNQISEFYYCFSKFLVKDNKNISFAYRHRTVERPVDYNSKFFSVRQSSLANHVRNNVLSIEGESKDFSIKTYVYPKKTIYCRKRMNLTPK